MKIVWKKKANDESGKKRSRAQLLALNPNLPFEREEEDDDESNGADKRRGVNAEISSASNQELDQKQMAESLESQGNQLAEEGKYSEALQKWEGAIMLIPERALLHEQKAQVLLEMGDTWSAIKAATRATELEPLWAEAWTTLGRAQLNYGEPDLAIKSFDRALTIKPNHEEAAADREAASHLVKRRKQLHATDLSIDHVRCNVGDKVQYSNTPIPNDVSMEHPSSPILTSDAGSLTEDRST